MPRFSRITKKLLGEVTDNADLNEALYRFQNAIGIDSGDVAGVVFSGGWDIEWATATVSRRHEMMTHYIAAERALAGH